MSEAELAILSAKWADAIQSDVLVISKVEKVFLQGQHPFTVGPKHVEFASDNFGGILGKACLDDPRCPGCDHRDMSFCGRRYDDPVHKSELTAFVSIKRECTMKEVMDLLKANVEGMKADKIEGFGFLNSKLITDWGK